MSPDSRRGERRLRVVVVDHVARLSGGEIALAPRLRDVRRETVRPGRLDPRALVHVPVSVFRLGRRLRALDADLVHTNSLKAAFYGGVAARLVGVPAVWHVRDRIASDYLPRAAVVLVRAASRFLPTAIVANSRTTLQTLPALRSASVLYNPVIPDAVEPVAALEQQRHADT